LHRLLNKLSSLERNDIVI